MKYVIKNCPCLYILRDMDLICKNTPTEQKECHLISDCLLKRIVDECKKEIEIPLSARGDLAERILSEFEIEEVE